jgi:CDP-paratose 2-epimerase
MYGLPTIVFRMSCIAGEMQYGNEDHGWIAHFLYRALQGAPIAVYGDGRQVRDVLYVGDLIEAMNLARLSVPLTAGQIYNIGGGPENTVSLLELIAEVERLFGIELKRAQSLARPGDQLIYVSDYKKFARHTGWFPRFTVRQTLQSIYEFWKQHPEVFGSSRIPINIDAAPAPELAYLERTA